MHADINEATEVNNVTYCTLELHIGLEILDVEDIAGENGSGSIVTNVTAGLFKLVDNINEGGLTATKLTGKLRCAVLISLELKELKVIICNVLCGEAKLLQYHLCDSVGLGVNACVIENVLCAGDTKEACALLVCLVTDLGNLENLGAGLELAVLFPKLNDVLCRSGIDTRNVGKERVGRGVNINANAVYTILNYTAKSLGKSSLLHIVLILTNADSLGLDLNKLRKGILKSSCDRDRASLHYVIVGKFLGGNLRSGVNRCACLGNDCILCGLGAGGIVENMLDDELLGLTGCCTVTDSDNVNAVFSYEVKNYRFGSCDVLSGFYGVDNRGVKHLTGLVNYRKLTAVGIAGVVAENCLALDGRHEKKVTKVLGEYFERTLAGIVKECCTHFPLDCREKKACVRIVDGCNQIRKGG